MSEQPCRSQLHGEAMGLPPMDPRAHHPPFARPGPLGRLDVRSLGPRSMYKP
jgi:hypothetical protein